MEKKTWIPSRITKRDPDVATGVIFNGAKLVVKIDNFEYC